MAVFFIEPRYKYSICICICICIIICICICICRRWRVQSASTWPAIREMLVHLHKQTIWSNMKYREQWTNKNFKSKIYIEREKIYFSQALRIIHISHLFKINRWGRMVNTDHLPTTPGSFFCSSFLTFLEHDSIANSYLTKGEMPFTAKIVQLFLKKVRKRI